MARSIENLSNEVHISAAELENANLSEWDHLELHLLDQAAVVIPGMMTIMDIFRTAGALQGLASDLLSAIGAACESCDNCQMDEPCQLMTEPIQPEVSVPGYALENAGLDENCKLTCSAAQGSDVIQVTEADYRYDLTDLRPDLLDMFRECGICMKDLEDKLIQETIVYSGKSFEKFPG